MRRIVERGLGGLAGPCVLLGAAGALASTDHGATDLTALSLEELMSIEVTVTSAAKRPQRLGDAAAAVFVLTGDEIRRSGATSIPEALRLVPGVQVSRVGSNKWFVTARGFSGRDANKLLVLVDGVSAYTPLFSGILWEREGTFLEDVDRIEVVRGPGASLWGANAVNGVINIVTKPAERTQGGLVTATAGTEERGSFGVRYGGRLGGLGHVRFYGEATARDSGGTAAPGSEEDDSRLRRTGFRADLDLTARDRLTLQGDLFAGRTEDTAFAPLFSPPWSRAVSADARESTANVRAHWRRTLSDVSHLAVQAYYQNNKYDSVLGSFLEETADIEAEHRFALGERHDVVWGLGARWYRSRIGEGLIESDPAVRAEPRFSVFVQDTVTLVPDTLTLTAGSKLEHTDYAGLAVQPTVRAAWTPDREQVVWAAVSRAVRTPSRAERDFTGIQQVVPTPFGPPLAVSLMGDSDLESETVVAYEAGYRVRPAPSLSVDVAAFYNVYDDLRVFAAEPPVAGGGAVPYLLLPVTASNAMHGETYGVEVAAEWEVRPGWRLRGAYSALRMDLTAEDPGGAAAAEATEGGSPLHQLVLRSSHDLAHDLQLDVAVRAVDRLRTGDLDGYVGLDVRVAWRPTEGWELALVGQNLIGADRLETTALTVDQTPSRVESALYARLTRRF
ncbi:TonB-dependent receptor plug domain-containing protein [Azospirillum sp. A39]